MNWYQPRRIDWRRKAPPVNSSGLICPTAITDQTKHKEIFESVASQRFQKFPWFGFKQSAVSQVTVAIIKDQIQKIGAHKKCALQFFESDFMLSCT